MSLCCDDAVKMTSSTSIPQCPASEATMVSFRMTSSPLQTGVSLNASSLPGTCTMVFTSKSSWPWKMLRMRLDKSVPWLSNNIHRRHTKSSREYFSWTELVKLQFNNSSCRHESVILPLIILKTGVFRVLFDIFCYPCVFLPMQWRSLPTCLHL